MLWILFAFGSAFFAGITAVLAKIGIEHINSTLATAVRTVVVLAFSWLMVFVVGSQNTIGQITGNTLLFLILSGLSTGAPGCATSRPSSWVTLIFSTPMRFFSTYSAKSSTPGAGFWANQVR